MQRARWNRLVSQAEKAQDFHIHLLVVVIVPALIGMLFVSIGLLLR